MELKFLKNEFIGTYSNKNTKRAYGYALTPFVNFLQEKKVFKITELKREHFNLYSSHLHRKDLTLISIKIKLHTINSFYKFLYDMDYIPDSYLKRLAIPKKAPIKETPGLSDFEAKEILSDSITQGETDFIRIRDKLIFNILLYQGLRIHEVANIKLKNINLNKKSISTLFVEGKGGTGHFMAIKKENEVFFEMYLKARKKRLKKIGKNENIPELILTSKGKAKGLSTIQMRQIIQIRVKQIGLNKKISPHWFRVTSISHIEEKIGLSKAALFARHKDIRTTTKYLRRRKNIEEHPCLSIKY